MRRRALIGGIGGAMFLRPLAARAQQPAMPVVGYLSAGWAEASAPLLPHFGDGLKESGYIVGRNVVIEGRWAEGRDERLPALAAELVALNVAVIAAFSSTVAQAARQVTQTTPIVFASSDSVALGLVTSLSRPGGNATGVSMLSSELAPKRLELLRDLIPRARSVAFLANPDNPLTASELRDVQAGARATGLSLQVFEARTGSEIEQAFARLAEARPDAVLVGVDPVFLGQRDQIVTLAARHALPAIYEFSAYVAAGGLISYGANLKHAVRMVGAYAGKILSGARPADLPVQQASRLELVINLRTAKALGLVVPPSLLARADEVIE